MHEYSPEHSRPGTVRYERYSETEEEGKKRKTDIERSTAGTNKEVPTAQPQLGPGPRRSLLPKAVGG